MPAADIVIRGAREHNLQNVDVVLPRNQLICLTGVSGSGKSSLAFDTLYAEGQRRYVESLSSFARQFLGQMPKPDVDFIGGLSPSISISQKTAGNNPRSTVGTITEIYDYLRVLYARVGTGYCPQCDQQITAQTREEIVERILQSKAEAKLAILAPIIRGQKGEYRDLFDDLLKQGYVRARVDGEIVALSEDLNLDRQMRHDIEVVVDRFSIKKGIRSRVAEAVELALKLGQGNLIVHVDQGRSQAAPQDPLGGTPTEATGHTRRTRPRRRRTRPGDTTLSANYACASCGLSFEPPSPQLFSFNSPQGMCFECDGLGQMFTFDPDLLVPDSQRSFQQGCFEILGRWSDLGRWKRHIYQGVADSIERLQEIAPGKMLETPWCDLPDSLRDIWLWGSDDTHITFTWRGGERPQKYGGTWEGIIPTLLSKYRNTEGKIHLRRLEKYMSTIVCPDCHGERLVSQARAVRLHSNHPGFSDNPRRSLPEVCALAVSDAALFFSDLELDATRSLIAAEALKEISGRLGFLTNVGLDYLTLERTAPTLSGGETQRIRLAGQIGCGLVGVLYILDEPSIGLHPRDNERLLQTLTQLRDMGNTVVVVEHDEETMRSADHLIDFGPGPGVRGGHVVASGSVDKILASRKSITAQYLSGKQAIEVPSSRRSEDKQCLRILGAAENNLRNIDVEIPLGRLVCFTGVSGSGKSSLVNRIIGEALRRDLNGGQGEPGRHDRIEGLEHLDKLIAIDQSPIGRTPRSNPGTYIKVFDEIRSLYSQLPDSKRRGYKPGRFSFNVKGGRCEACEGNGATRLEMDFLADVWVKCPVCEGHRFSRETLQVRFKGKTIADVLELDIQQALELFENVPKIQKKLQTLQDVGLDYLKLGQPSPTLSGGEAQRIKLARELVKRSTGRTMYLLDEPTTGLHFADIKLLLKVLQGFVEVGNTVVIVEHNLDVVKTADWVIDLGPEGGAGGGQVVATGTPEDLVKLVQPNEKSEKSVTAGPSRQGPSHTSVALSRHMRGDLKSTELPKNGKKSTSRGKTKLSASQQIVVQGARQHNLKHVDVTIPRDKMTVFCGPSGSGKTSLAMDTIYAEGQRRYVESLSSYARQFVSQMQKPKLDRIEGLSPAIAIEQRHLGHTPRSTVGTVTEIYDYLRILMARLGKYFCPDCDLPIGTQTTDEIIDKVLSEPAGTKLYLLAPVEIEVGQQYETFWEECRAAGYVRVRVDGTTHSLDNPPAIDRRRKHEVEIVVDRVVISDQSRSRIAESIEGSLALGRGLLRVAYQKKDTEESRWDVVTHSQHLSCDCCGRSFEHLTPHNFSFNSQLGWCPECEGLGTQIGANPAALLNDPHLSLQDGALNIWPRLDMPVSQWMLQAFSTKTGIPLDVPFDQLTTRQRRLVMHGTEEEWYEVFSEKLLKQKAQSKQGSRPSKKQSRRRPLFRFQFKGIYPALEEASRLSPSFRSKLDHLVDEVECSTCEGSRLRDDAAAMRFRGQTVADLSRMPLHDIQRTIRGWKFNSRERKIAGEVVREIKSRVQFLCDVGLEYLALGRSAATLSGGEFQRIRLASQLGSGLCGVLYVLDEPTIGLHARDNHRLLAALKKLRDLGNTLVVVEHDREVLQNADEIRDFGPGAGIHGGKVVAKGTTEQITKRRASVTGPYLSGKKSIPIPSDRRMKSGAKNSKRGSSPSALDSNPRTDWIEIRGARQNNLKNINVRIPLGTLTAFTGVSGSGKSSLVDEVLYSALARTLHRADTTPGVHETILGIQHINKVIRVDQRSLGNSPHSNPATYTGVFDLIRQLFSQLPEAKLRGYTQRRFSFNVPGGRCEECEGNGQICIEMHFLPDVWVECDTCRGRRYNKETLAVRYHGQSIDDVLKLPCGEALKLFDNISKIRRTLQTLCDVGLDYLTLGQPAPTLSGGEAQRVKLAAELSRPDTGRTLYLLDEPTTGLHFDDLRKLLDVLHRLVDLGNTVVVIEHNLDVVKSADWVIDMGPGAGEQGGRVVAVGTPEDLVRVTKRHGRVALRRKTDTNKTNGQDQKSTKSNGTSKSIVSYTGVVLADVLAAGPYEKRKAYDLAAETREQNGDLDITEVGRDQKMPWELDGQRWHTQDRVGRDGLLCRWDGRILSEIVERVQESGEFSPVDWKARSVVEIAASKKSDGWFIHAITGETWFVKLKFRVVKNTFRRGDLQEDLKLKSFNDLEEIPVYGNEPRVQCKNLRGPWQEVQIKAHSFKEIDTPEFWHFLDRAQAGFKKMTERTASNPDDIMPWKKLGQRWHWSRKGFPPGKRIQWDLDLLEELCEMLRETVPEGQFLWNNQQVVHLMVQGQKEPWASIFTKKLSGVDLYLTGPKGNCTLGRIAELGVSRELDTMGRDKDVVKLRLQTVEDLQQGNLPEFLSEHLSIISAQKAAKFS